MNYLKSFLIIFRISDWLFDYISNYKQIVRSKWDPQLLCPSLAGYHMPQIFHWTVFLHMAPVYIYFIYFVLFFMRTFNKNQKAKKTREAGRGRKKQTSFLTALVKNAKKSKGNEAKERIEKRTSKKHIRKKLTTSKWQRSVHKFLKYPQQANVKPKYHKKN